ncbi:MAG TPA: RagB/SusD family nutrient uptake outer membrane protein, partial [Sphingobacteriaceae bacterium]
DIVLERRKELAFEGERFHTLNRLGMDITDRVDGPPSVAYDDFRRILPIPQVEIDANPTLATQQNPSW